MVRDKTRKHKGGKGRDELVVLVYAAYPVVAKDDLGAGDVADAGLRVDQKTVGIGGAVLWFDHAVL